MARTRLGYRRGPQKQNRWSLYIPSDFLLDFNEINKYARKRGLSLAFVIRQLLEAWYAQEIGGTVADNQVKREVHDSVADVS